MKKYILSLLALSALLFTTSSIAFAEPEGDIDPGTNPGITCNEITLNLRIGMSDSSTNGQVTLLQRFLVEEGLLNVSPTGYFGNATFRAVKTFQSQQGLLNSGYVGPLTRAAISKVMGCTSTNPSPTPTPAPNPTPSTIIIDKVDPAGGKAEDLVSVRGRNFAYGMTLHFFPATSSGGTQSSSVVKAIITSQDMTAFSFFVPAVSSGTYTVKVTKSGEAVSSQSASFTFSVFPRWNSIEPVPQNPIQICVYRNPDWTIAPVISSAVPCGPTTIGTKSGDATCFCDTAYPVPKPVPDPTPTPSPTPVPTPVPNPTPSPTTYYWAIADYPFTGGTSLTWNHPDYYNGTKPQVACMESAYGSTWYMGSRVRNGSSEDIIAKCIRSTEPAPTSMTKMQENTLNKPGVPVASFVKITPTTLKLKDTLSVSWTSNGGATSVQILMNGRVLTLNGGSGSWSGTPEYLGLSVGTNLFSISGCANGKCGAYSVQTKIEVTSTDGTPTPTPTPEPGPIIGPGPEDPKPLTYYWAIADYSFMGGSSLTWNHPDYYNGTKPEVACTASTYGSTWYMSSRSNNGVMEDIVAKCIKSTDPNPTSKTQLQENTLNKPTTPVAMFTAFTPLSLPRNGTVRIAWSSTGGATSVNVKMNARILSFTGGTGDWSGTPEFLQLDPGSHTFVVQGCVNGTCGAWSAPTTLQVQALPTQVPVASVWFADYIDGSGGVRNYTMYWSGTNNPTSYKIRTDWGKTNQRELNFGPSDNTSYNLDDSMMSILGFDKPGTHTIDVQACNSVGCSAWVSSQLYVSSGTQGATLASAAVASGVLGASAMCVNLPFNMHRGNETPNVSKLQEFLKNKGLLTEVTGYYGDKTVNAVKEYQKNRGLPITGMTYELTRSKIASDSCN